MQVMKKGVTSDIPYGIELSESKRDDDERNIDHKRSHQEMSIKLKPTPSET
jgi:hypothetical protein